MNPSRILTVLLAGLVLLAGSALGSYAANGGPLLLGQSNSATKHRARLTTRPFEQMFEQIARVALA